MINKLHFSDFYSLAAMIVATIGVVSCSDMDYGYSENELEYKRNFEDEFGEIPANKSWDLTTWANGGAALNTSSSSYSAKYASAATRAALVENTMFYTSPSYWQVPAKTLTWMKDYLEEGHNNTYLGSNFFLELPENDFAIVPIFQGNSAIMSELEVKINGYDLTPIWTKSENIQVKGTWSEENGTVTVTESNFHDVNYYGGVPGYDRYYTSEESAGCYPATTLYATAVQSKPIYFNRSNIHPTENSNFMYLSLHNIGKLYTSEGHMWDENNTWTTVGDHLTSLNSNGMMLALDVPADSRPAASDLPTISSTAPSQVMMIACEDANGASTDNDLNDVVFLIIGYPNVPKVVSTTEYVKKRYMIEDLGGTDDFDFNDVVVDVTQKSEYEINLPSGSSTDEVDDDGASVEITGKTLTSQEQYASVVHLGGTLPFQVQVGDTYFPVVNDPQNQYSTRRDLWKSTSTTRTTDFTDSAPNGWAPNETKTVTGWNPTTNNVKVYVKWDVNVEKKSNDYDASSEEDYYADFANGNVKVVDFPEKGQVPYIIAVDQDIPWMLERQKIPQQWIDGNIAYRDGVLIDEVSVNSLYYTNDGNNSEGEAQIWKGSVTGKADQSGIMFKKSSAEYNGFVKAINANYNIINVYYTASDAGKIGLCCDKSGSNSWSNLTNLTDGDADSYMPSTYATSGSTKIYKTTIYLTDEQMSAIKDYGLAVKSRTTGIVITQVTMSRDYNTYRVLLGNSTNGRITSPYSARDAKSGDASYDLKPFVLGSVSKTGSVKLEAVPDAHYHFVRWELDDTWNNANATARYNSTLDFNPGKDYYNSPLKAVFEIDSYTVTPLVNSGSGTVQITKVNGTTLATPVNTNETATYSSGTKITLKATPALGYKFVNWTNGDTNTERELTVESNCSPGAVFELDSKKLKVSSQSSSPTSTISGGTWEKIAAWDIVSNAMSWLQQRYGVKIRFDFSNQYGIGDFKIVACAPSDNSVAEKIWTLKSGDSFDTGQCAWDSSTRQLTFSLSQAELDSHFIYQTSVGNVVTLSDFYFYNSQGAVPNAVYIEIGSSASSAKRRNVAIRRR